MTSSPADLAQFGQWLTEHQSSLVQELYRQSREDQAVLVQKIQEGITAGLATHAADPAALSAPNPLKVARLTDEDDLEAYLTSFERTAKLAKWPVPQWTYILGPHLTGPAASVWRTLPMEDVPYYDKLKEALLDRYGFTEDRFRLRFSSIRYTAGARPRALVGELRDAAMRWLKPETAEGRRIVDKVVLHQLYQVLPADARAWVSRHRPSKLAEATRLAENFMDAEPTPARGPVTQRPRPAQGYGELKPMEGRARPTMRGHPFGAAGSKPLRQGGPARPGELAPKVFRPYAGAWPSPTREERGSPREAGQRTPPREEAVESRGERHKGPCYSCGQMGHFRRDCPFMECSLAAAGPRENHEKTP